MATLAGILLLHFVALQILAVIHDGAWLSRAVPVADWWRSAGLLLCLVWLLARVGKLTETRISAMGGRTQNGWDDFFFPVLGRAVRRLLPLVALVLGAPALEVSPGLQAVFTNVVSLLLIGGITFGLVELLNAAEMALQRRYRIDVADNLEARKIHTQVRLLKRVALFVIGVFAFGSALMVFSPVRQVGASILASAGITGLIVGLAAQKSIGTLLAGFQIAITQPIRLDDAVIVEGEFGNVEDITLTYVTIRTWDQRRLIVPIVHFIDHAFQNWSRVSTELLASVYLYVDFTVPVQEIREELTRILERSRHWDRRVNVLQVTDVKEHALELRALTSASSAGAAWDLRCELREQLVDFVRRQFPDSLPFMRMAIGRARPHAGPARAVGPGGE
jgi:small-conductance mechanosensitive channel